MEEKILEILVNNSSELDDVIEGDTDCLKAVYYPDVSKEIASHFREFIEWLLSVCETANINSISCSNLKSIDELYQYWLKEVKK